MQALQPCGLGAPRAQGNAPRAVAARRVAVRCSSSPTGPSSSGSAVLDKDKPDWAGEDLLSKVVNTAISIKPLFGLMKGMARDVLIKTAEKNGVQWREETKANLKDLRLQQLKQQVEDRSMQYPTYYTQEFHAYDEGNLCWQAAAEAESATYAMALRVWPEEVKAGQLSSDGAQQRLRDSYTNAVKTYREEQGSGEVRALLDMGCSVGISTRALAAAFPSAESVVGGDLSAYFLAVAESRKAEGSREQYVHVNAESTGMDDASYDLYSLAFVVHELPQHATRSIFKEAFRLVRPGGTIVLTDNNPRSEVIQNLPPALFTLMKSTEPWSDEYYTLDVEAALEEAGFVNATTVPSDPRHRTVLATKPL